MAKQNSEKQQAVYEKSKFKNKDFPVLARFGREENNTNGNRLAYHREMEIQFLKSGKGEYFIKNRTYSFSKNTLFFIQPNQVHGFIPGQSLNIEKGMVMFPLKSLKAEGKDYNIPKNFPNCIMLNERDAVEVELIFDNIANEKNHKLDGWQELVRLQLKRLILMIKRFEKDQPDAKSEENPVISWIVDYIEKNFEEELSLPSIAEKAGYSKYYISRLFKKCTGLGLKQYILQRRILEAKLLLVENPQLTVDAVAKKVGFNEFSLFNRSFKTFTGITPSQYRNISYPDSNI